MLTNGEARGGVPSSALPTPPPPHGALGLIVEFWKDFRAS